MKGRQLCGAIGIVVMAVSVYAVRDILRYLPLPGEAVVSSAWEETGIAVELDGDRDHDGIYFLPPGATVGDLFREAGVRGIAGFGERDLAGTLCSGDRVVCDTARRRTTREGMTVPTRLALGMPIDLNRATLEELMLIPGLGRGTASTVIEIRERQGRFSGVDELRDIPGMGEKRYDRIRRYLSVKGSSCS